MEQSITNTVDYDNMNLLHLKKKEIKKLFHHKSEQTVIVEW